MGRGTGGMVTGLQKTMVKVENIEPGSEDILIGSMGIVVRRQKLSPKRVKNRP